MSPNEYQQQSIATNLDGEGYKKVQARLESVNTLQLFHAQLGIASESGEFADAVKKFLIYGQPLDIKNIKEEAGDLLWYICLALTSVGWELEGTMIENVEKLKKRYPNKFTEKDALERKDKI